MIANLLKTKDDFKLTLIRVVAGGVMIAHGVQKLLGWFGGVGFTNTMQVFTHAIGVPAPLAFLVIIVESFGALGVILGCLSRIAAFGMVVDMVAAVLMVHIHFGFFMNWSGTHKGEGFEYHLMMIAMSLVVMIWGGGAFSIDRALSGNKDA